MLFIVNSQPGITLKLLGWHLAPEPVKRRVSRHLRTSQSLCTRNTHAQHIGLSTPPLGHEARDGRGYRPWGGQGPRRTQVRASHSTQRHVVMASPSDRINSQASQRRRGPIPAAPKEWEAAHPGETLAGSVLATVELLELEVLVGDQVQRALLELEPDDALRGTQHSGESLERGVIGRGRGVPLARCGAATTGRVRRVPAPSQGPRRARC